MQNTPRDFLVDPEVRSVLAKALSSRSRRGMNMTEILIVVAIIVILMSVLGFGALQAWGAFQVSQTKMVMKQIKQAVDAETQLVSKGKLPNSLKDLDWSAVGGEVPKDAWGGEIKYVITDAEKSVYDLVSLGNDGKEGGTGRAADLHLKDL